MKEYKKWNVNDQEIRLIIEQVKMEIAREYGVEVPKDGYWGATASKQLGLIGAQLQKRIPPLLAWKERQKQEGKRKGKKRNG
jgi:hypothetical protein